MARAWEYQGILSRSDARQWARYWALLGWAVRLQRTRKGHYHTFVKFPRRAL